MEAYACTSVSVHTYVRVSYREADFGVGFFLWKGENKSKRSSGQGGMGGLQGFRSLNCRPPNKITLKCH